MKGFSILVMKGFRMLKKGFSILRIELRIRVDFLHEATIIHKIFEMTLVFMSNSALRQKFNLAAFQEIFTNTDKIYISRGGLSTR